MTMMSWLGMVLPYAGMAIGYWLSTVAVSRLTTHDSSRRRAVWPLLLLVAGSRTVKVVPSPTVDLAVIVPPCAMTIS